MDLRICYACDPPHAENCPMCFGYGFPENGAPIEAGEAGEDWKEDAPYTPCPTCGGTPYNAHLLMGDIELPADRIERLYD